MQMLPVDRKWSRTTWISAEFLSFVTTFPQKGEWSEGSGGGYQGYIDRDRPISLGPDDLACDAADSSQVLLDRQ
jgi:hypothetical protein